MKGSFDFKGRRWKRLSAQSKEFVNSLLVVDPEDRCDADEALGSVWLNRRLTATVRNPHDEEIKNAKSSMVRYSGFSKLKKVALMVVAHKSSTSEIGILRKVFQKYDTKRDGQLSFEEFKAAMHDAGYGDDDYQRMFDAVVSKFNDDFLTVAQHYHYWFTNVSGFLAGHGRYWEDSLHRIFGSNNRSARRYVLG